MEKITVYGVCNRLSYENVYVFQDHEPIEEPFDVFEVELPEGYEVGQTMLGSKIITTTNGYEMHTYEAFKPEKTPVLSTVNAAGYPIQIAVNYRKVNDRQMYNPRYL